MIIIYEVYAVSVGAAYPVVSAETSAVRLRAASQSIGFFVNFVVAWAYAFTVPYMFDAGAGDLGGKVGFIFASFSLAAFAIVWFEILEMKNRTFAELDEMFQNKVPTRKFGNYVCTTQIGISTKAEDAGLA